MRALAVLLPLLAAFCFTATVHAADSPPFHAFEEVRFPSLEVIGATPTQITGYLFRPATKEPRAAVVLMHAVGVW